MELTDLEKRDSGQICRHDRDVYWKSFLKLRDLGIIIVTESSTANALPLAHCNCALSTRSLYSSFLTQSDTNIKKSLKCLTENPLAAVTDIARRWAIDIE